jgi:hypothetical protein
VSKFWRDALSIHPAADLLPRMSRKALIELGEDIKANGLLQPIVFFRNKLLDGINRLDAMEMAGIKFNLWREDKSRFELSCEETKLLYPSLTLDDDADPYAFVLSANLHRRHLTGEQKRELVAKVLIATPEKSDRQIAREAHSNRTTVGQIRAGMEKSGDVSIADTRTDTKGRSQPAHKASPAVIAAADRAETSSRNAAMMAVPEDKDVALFIRCIDMLSPLAMKPPTKYGAAGAHIAGKLRRICDFLYDVADAAEKSSTTH